MNPFDYVNSITLSKRNIMVTPEDEKGYAAFLINRGLSQFQDTIFYANEMNRYHKLDNKLQYQFLINIVRKRKRFSKWAKADTADADIIEAIKIVYNYSNDKARQVVGLLSKDQKSALLEKIHKGGT